MEIGEKVKFTPAANVGKAENFGEILLPPVTGEIVQIIEEHRWFRVRYTVGAPPVVRHETFKF